MEDLDIDHVVDIPDTPDRPVTRDINAGEITVSGHLGNSDFKDEEFFNRPSCRGRVVSEIGHNKRLHMHRRKNSSGVDKIEHSSNVIDLSPAEKQCQNASLFRRTVIDRNRKHESQYSSGAQHMDKEKRICSKFPSKSSTLRKDDSVIDLTEQGGHGRLFEMAFPHGQSKDLPAIEIGKSQVAASGSSSLHCAPNTSKPSIKSSKGKEKIEGNTSKAADSIIDHGKAIDRGKAIDPSGGLQNYHEKQMYASYHPVSPRVTGQKRLVRNGCISPYNIEMRTKQLAQRSQKSSSEVKQSPSMDMVSLHPGTIDMSDIVAEDNKHHRYKGVTIHPCTSKEHDKVYLSKSSAANNEVNRNSPTRRGAFGCNEEVGGWRSTHYHSKKVDQQLSNATGLQLRRNDDVGCLGIKQHEGLDNWGGKAYGHKDENAAQTVSRLVSEPNQINQPCLVGTTVPKRQKKHELTSRNRGQSSRMVSDDSKTVVLGSSGESSRSRLSIVPSDDNHGIVEINSPEIRHGNYQGAVCINDDDSVARARQLEADEILALRLQEQLYHELPEFGGGETDVEIAWLLQREEDAHTLSNGNRRVSNPRTSSINSRRQTQSRILPNPSNRRGIRARVNTSSGMESLRNRFLNRSRAAPPRARNLQFPSGMDLDMRLDILEAIEAAVGDLSDTGTARHISELQRDFNENDYEMLLALDENNHQHGASSNQINSLPLSTVQTENFEEACAVCLDTPAMGETIRHLPCLHKFHKACIDPWLGRKSSCPICKSSIT